jgi:LuxR family maltose regulon positive regulatory protein
MLIDRMPLINAGTLLDCVLSAYFVMARIAVHRMNLERAHTLLERAESQGNARGWGRRAHTTGGRGSTSMRSNQPSS